MTPELPIKLEIPASPETERRHLLVQIIGPTGSGKTTLAKLISQKLGFHLVQEEYKGNPFFDDYYRDPERWSLEAQLWFLLKNVEQTQDDISVALKNGPVVSEPATSGNKLYAQTRLENLKLQWELYQSVYEAFELEGKFLLPDLLAYARVSFPGMLGRIEWRAKREPKRAVELNEKKEYWRRLWQLHEEWVAENPLGLKIFTINTEHWDFSFETNDIAAQEATINDFLNWSRYHLVGRGGVPEDIIIPEPIVNHRPPVATSFEDTPR